MPHRMHGERRLSAARTGSVQPCHPPQNTYQDTIMDAERINLIGNTLSDLTVRTQELRRYL